MKGERARAFFAVELPEAARDVAIEAIDALARGCDADVRWVPAENLHLTVKFLGDVEVERLPELARRVAAKLVRERPFEVELAGLGAFPSARAARVLWLGIASGASELARLARKTDAAVARLGVPREHRPYRAHLTLGRLRSPARFSLERVRAPDPVAFPVRELVLLESRPPAQAGASPEYVPLVRLPIGADEAPDMHFDFAPES
jgi:2'-5' RNA ligase